jgi:hypothetical protein
MRKLTVKLSRCSKSLIMDGADRNLTDSGELLQRGTAKIHRLRLSEFDSCSKDIYSNMAELWGFSLWLGKAYSGEDKVHRS